MEAALVLIRFLHFAAAILVFGLLAFQIYGLRAAYDLPRLDRLLVLSLRWFTAIGFTVAVFWLALETGLMNDSPAAVYDFAAIKTVLFETSFGTAWQVHLVLGALLLLTIFSGGWPIYQLLAAGLFLLSLAFTGHAMMDSGWMGAAHRLNQSLHLLAGGLWVGGLYALSLALAHGPALKEAASTFRCAILQRFSAVGYGAVAVVVLTGSFNSWMIVGDWRQVLSSRYGQLLALKIGMVMIMIALAAMNRFILMPQLARPQKTPLLFISVLLELMGGVVVLALVSTFATLPPP